MNELSFRRYAYTLVFKRNLQNRWRPRPPLNLDLIVPVIDGKTVQEILNHGGYAGLPAHYVEPQSTQWSGPPGYGDDGLAAILDGGCGVVGCCGVQASITFDETTVRWSGFRTGTGKPDEHEFVFDRAAYDAAINGIAKLSVTPVVETV
ncbi:MAG: hypothetical protein K8R99_14510 [Actinomycetia bacterium]|nr:hypothetical protein [Actinomycetes bacterium]